MKSVCRADHLRHLSGLQRVGEFDERFGHRIDAAPAEIAAFERILRIGVADRRSAEIKTAIELLLHVVGLGLGLFDLLGACVFGQRDQDVREVDLTGLDVAGSEQRIDFGVGDLS